MDFECPIPTSLCTGPQHNAWPLFVQVMSWPRKFLRMRTPLFEKCEKSACPASRAASAAEARSRPLRFAAVAEKSRSAYARAHAPPNSRTTCRATVLRPALASVAHLQHLRGQRRLRASRCTRARGPRRAGAAARAGAGAGASAARTAAARGPRTSEARWRKRGGRTPPLGDAHGCTEVLRRMGRGSARLTGPSSKRSTTPSTFLQTS